MALFNAELAQPMMAVMCLTLVVWVYLFVQRIGYLNAHDIDAQQLQTPESVAALIPPEYSSASHNFRNLLELPVLFYATCLYLTFFGLVDSLHIKCAWIFVGCRCLHSLVHCTYNRVNHRFIAYAVSALALWVMVVRGALAAF